MQGGGVPHCPWSGGPWGEHGVCPLDEPLRAGGRSCSGLGVVCQGLAPLDGGDRDVLALGVLAGSPEHEVYDSLVEAVAWGGQVSEGFDAELGPALL